MVLCCLAMKDSYDDKFCNLPLLTYNFFWENLLIVCVIAKSVKIVVVNGPNTVLGKFDSLAIDREFLN